MKKLRTKYRAIINVLESIFSVDIGLTEEVEKKFFDQAINNEVYRIQLHNELKLALSDKDLSWIQLLENEDYEVDSPDSEEEAREYVLDIFWSKIFPGKKRPD